MQKTRCKHVKKKVHGITKAHSELIIKFEHILSGIASCTDHVKLAMVVVRF